MEANESPYKSLFASDLVDSVKLGTSSRICCGSMVLIASLDCIRNEDETLNEVISSSFLNQI